MAELLRLAAALLLALAAVAALAFAVWPAPRDPMPTRTPMLTWSPGR